MSNPDSLPDSASGCLSIADVARETGVMKDTLRVWERRYGFPQPVRDAHGERRYPAEQVQRIGLIKRLLDAGRRPGAVVALPMPDLLAHLRGGEAPVRGAPLSTKRSAKRATAAAPAHPPAGLEFGRWIRWVRAGDVGSLHRALSQHALKHGLLDTIDGLLGPLGAAVGHAWWTGDITVAHEHLYTEAVHRFLHDAIHKAEAAGQRLAPRVLLSTLPGEQHTLGLLMAECVLALEGCERVSLGRDTPLPDMVAAAGSWQVDVVALSVSGNAPASEVWGGLTALRQNLPPQTAIWAGGASPHLSRPGMPAGVDVLTTVGSLAARVEAWRQDRAEGVAGTPSG